MTEFERDDYELSSSEMPVETSSVKRRLGLVLLIGLCGVGFFIADVATPSYWVEGVVPAMFFLGLVTAQLTVICVWGTLVEGSFWIRLPWTLLLLVISWCGFAWGIQLERGRNVDSMLPVAFFWTIGFLTSFVPLKIAAMGFRWRITGQSTRSEVLDRDGRYSIRDMMLGTLLLAISMAIGRVMLVGEEEIDFGTAFIMLNEPGAILTLAVFGVVSLLVKMPCIWIALGAEREKAPSYIVLWTFYCVLLAAVEILIFIAIVGGPPGDVLVELCGGIVLGHLVMGAVTLFVCLCLRGLGYKLERAICRTDGAQF